MEARLESSLAGICEQIASGARILRQIEVRVPSLVSDSGKIAGPLFSRSSRNLARLSHRSVG